MKTFVRLFSVMTPVVLTAVGLAADIQAQTLPSVARFVFLQNDPNDAPRFSYLR